MKINLISSLFSWWFSPNDWNLFVFYGKTAIVLAIFTVTLVLALSIWESVSQLLEEIFNSRK